jgi:hypothetical protein
MPEHMRLILYKEIKKRIRKAYEEARASVLER